MQIRSVVYTRCTRGVDSKRIITLLHGNELSAHAVCVPSGRWQSFPAPETWPPSAVAGTAPPASPSLSPPKTFPRQPAGTERKAEQVMPFRIRGKEASGGGV